MIIELDKEKNSRLNMSVSHDKGRKSAKQLALMEKILEKWANAYRYNWSVGNYAWIVDHFISELKQKGCK